MGMIRADILSGRGTGIHGFLDLGMGMIWGGRWVGDDFLTFGEVGI